MLNFTSDQWVIVALIFVLGLLVGGFLFAGGGRKWKHRYNAEVDRREQLERDHQARERDWREQESLRNAAARDRRDLPASEVRAEDRARGDYDHDGVPDRDERP